MREPEEFVKVSGGLLLLYGFGTMIGPVLGAALMSYDCVRRACSWRPRSRISLLAAYTLLRISRRAPVPQGAKDAFKTLPADRAVTPEVAAARSAHQAVRKLTGRLSR